MTLFESLKMRYEKNWCRKDQLQQYVALGAITPEQYEEITGEPYSTEYGVFILPKNEVTHWKSKS